MEKLKRSGHYAFLTHGPKAMLRLEANSLLVTPFAVKFRDCNMRETKCSVKDSLQRLVMLPCNAVT